MAIKKTWYEIVAPEMFGKKIIGETLSVDPKQLLGRSLEVSLADLSKDYSRYYIKVRLMIDRVDGQKAFTKFIGHDSLRERIFRMVQRKTRRVDCIQDIQTKDGKRVRVKTILILPKRVRTSIKDAVRKGVADIVKKVSSETDFESFVNMIIFGTLQQTIKNECKKIYPISKIEIRKSEVLKERKKR
jgi:small subunit ribosomal protein S3Ae